VRYRLHQFAHFGFEKIIGHDKRADGGAQIAVAGGNGLIDGRLQPIVVCLAGLSMGGHRAFPRGDRSGSIVLFLFWLCQSTLFQSAVEIATVPRQAGPNPEPCDDGVSP